MSDIVRDTIAALVAQQTRLSSTAVAPLGYGVDLVCVSDIDLQLQEADPESNAAIAQDVFHRLTTSRGSIPDDPNFGYDVRSLLSKGLTQSTVRGIATQAQGEVLKDDRIAACEVDLVQSGSISAPTFTLTVTITPQRSSAPFDLILSVTGGQALLLEITK